MPDLTGVRWFTSSRSGGGECVEVAGIPPGTVGVRDSKDRRGPVLTFERRAWRAFVAGVRRH
jgi:hypothetical protein